MVNYSSRRLDSVFSALADPTRRAILEQLTHGALNVTELARPFDISLPAVSKHVRVLEKAGLLIRRRDGRIHHCSLDARPIRGAAKWLERYKRFWQAQLDALDDYLTTSTKKEKKESP
jgi:DNA-binding transcriptional ArsR family regulator